MSIYGNNKEKAIELILDIPEILTGKKKIRSGLTTEDIQKMNNIADVQLVSNLFFEAYQKVLTDDIKQEQQDIKRHIKKKLDVLYDAIEKISIKFEQLGIPFWIIKGFTLSQKIYGTEYVRDFNDLDIIVNKSDIELASKAMLEIGFTTDLNLEICKYMDSLNCYELGFFYPFDEDSRLGKKYRGRISTELKIDTSSIRNSELMSELKKNSISTRLKKIYIKEFSVNDTFILLCTNIYSNFENEFAKAKIRDLFDIYFFINNTDLLDWKYIYNMCNKYCIVHKVFAVFDFFNKVYPGYISEEIVKMFVYDKITYDKSGFNNFVHCRMRDWNIDDIDIMLSRSARNAELFFTHSLKTYSSKNLNYKKYYYIGLTEKEKNHVIWKPGLKSKQNELEYEYSFEHDRENVYFMIRFVENSFRENVKTVLILFDIDRNTPRKMIEFSWDGNQYGCKSLLNNVDLQVDRTTLNEIVISIKKEQFNVLQNEGRVLAYRIYSVRKFNKINYEIKDDLNVFDFENPKLLYLYSYLEQYSF